MLSMEFKTPKLYSGQKFVKKMVIKSLLHTVPASECLYLLKTSIFF